MLAKFRRTVITARISGGSQLTPNPNKSKQPGTPPPHNWKHQILPEVAVFEAELVDERLVRLALFGNPVTLVCGYGAGATFEAAGWVSQPLPLAITLPATSLGLVGQRGARNVPPG